MTTLRHYLGRARQWSRLKLFGNNHSAKTNVLYLLYHFRCRRVWKHHSGPQHSAADQAARTLQDRGFVIFPSAVDQSLIKTLGSTVDGLFERSKDSVQISQGLFRLRDGLELVPRIIEFVTPEIEQAVEQYFESHFKIYGVYFYRTIPTEAQDTSSFLWHVDNCPRQEIKLMVYLDNTVADTGAFRLKPKPLSDELRARGFWDRKKNERFGDRLEEAATTAVLEGPAGTSILFQNGGCIHKATFPERTHRDVATFVIIPSPIPWRVHFSRHRHLLSTNSGVCLNPFTDRPQSVGYLE